MCIPFKLNLFEHSTRNIEVLWLIYIAGDGLGYGLGPWFLSFLEKWGAVIRVQVCAKVTCSVEFIVAIGFGIRIRVGIRVRLSR